MHHKVKWAEIKAQRPVSLLLYQLLADITVAFGDRNMPLLRRHKYILLILLVYWPGLFVLTHIPIPELARKSGMSDKTMHALAYLALVFLWWFSISPYKKVDWRKARVWLALAVMVWYSAFDEWLQGRIGRSADVHDFYANLAGVLFGLAILSVLSFWPGSVIVSALFILAVTNFSKIDTLWQWPYLNPGVHFLGFAGFTLIWIQYMHRYMRTWKGSHIKWFVTALFMPAGLLAGVKLCSIVIGKQVWLIDCLIALSGISCAALISWLTFLAHGKGLNRPC